jgi:hypothetical protein
MTPQQLLGIGIRLFALWLLLSSFPFLVTVPDNLAASSLETDGARALSLTLGAAHVLVAALLWFFPMLVAHKLIPKTRHQDYLQANALELARVGSGLLGLWLAAKSLPDIVWFIFRTFLHASTGANFAPIAADQKLGIAVSAFEIGLGIALIVKSSAFARLLVPQAPASEQVNQ